MSGSEGDGVKIKKGKGDRRGWGRSGHYFTYGGQERLFGKVHLRDGLQEEIQLRMSVCMLRAT